MHQDLLQQIENFRRSGRLATLVTGYRFNCLTPDEKAELEAWLAASEVNR